MQVLCTVAFVRLFVDTPRLFPRADRQLILPLAALMLLVPLLFPLWWWLANTLAAFGAIAAVLAVTALVIVAQARGQLKLRSFLLAVLVFWASAVAFLLKQVGVIGDHPLLGVMHPVLSGLIPLLFAIAVAERFRLLANQGRVALRRSEAQLEETVAARTHALADAKRRAEEALGELHAAQDELIRSEKMAALGGLVAGVAHEINTPLGVATTASSHIAEASQQLARQLDAGSLRKSELQAYLADVEQAAQLVSNNLDRAAHLVRSFKQVSVDRSNDPRRRFDLAEYLDTVAESLEPAWKHRPLTVSIRCPAGIELDSFPGALGQVVTELVQNALMHGFDDPARSGHIGIEVRRVHEEAVELVFIDNGSGIAPEHLPNIFDPFFTTRRGDGRTGLGLHVTFNLVAHQLGGRIRIASSPDSGTLVTVQIPVRAPARS